MTDTNKIDAIVAERVMGQPRPAPMTFSDAERLANDQHCSCFEIERDGWYADIDWGAVTKENRRDEFVEWTPRLSPSTDMNHAMEPAGKFTDVAMEKAGEMWHVTISGAFTAENRSLPLAISIAALRAVGVEVPDAM